MLLSDLRARVLSRVIRGETTFDDEAVDYAIQAALHEMSLTAYFSTSVTDAVTFEANNPELDVSTLNLRPESIIRAELAFTDRGTWASGTSYNVNDLVQGDGNPDSKFYVCSTANTAAAGNEPGTSGGDSFWTARIWQRGDKIRLLDRETIGRIMGDRAYLRPFVPDDYWFAQGPDDATGMPCVGGFWTVDLFYAYPVPDAAYKMVFLIRQPVDEWMAGTANATTIDVPNKVLLPAIEGMAWYLDPNHEKAPMWRQLFDRHIARVDGSTLVDGQEFFKDPCAYQDHTDRMDWYTGGWYER